MNDARYHTRGYLPHLELPEATQFLTWRLHDAIPPRAWTRILAETGPLPEKERRQERARRADRLLDESRGASVLREWRAAKAVEETLWFGHGRRYVLRAYAVMPNHVHAILTLLPGESLSAIMRSVKSYSAREVNRVLGRRGPLWQTEVFDRLIRSPEQFARTAEYIEWNPVKAKLVEDPRHFAFSSAFPANRDRLLA